MNPAADHRLAKSTRYPGHFWQGLLETRVNGARYRSPDLTAAWTVLAVARRKDLYRLGGPHCCVDGARWRSPHRLEARFDCNNNSNDNNDNDGDVPLGRALLGRGI